MDKNQVPASEDRYDLIVIGDTPEAIVAARVAGGRGRRVALVGSGGQCGPRSCELEAAAYVLRRAAASLFSSRAEPRDPLRPAAVPVDYRALLRRARKIASPTGETPDSPRPCSLAGATLYRGDARFVAPGALRVGGTRLAFRRAIVATGGQYDADETIAARRAGFLTTPCLLRLDAPPERLAVLGLGPRQCEWAQTFHRLGTQVHLMGREATILPGLDPEAVRLVQDQFHGEGIALHLGCDELELKRTGTSHSILIRRGRQREKLFVDQVLVDCPRRPWLTGLDLGAAGVVSTERGIAVGDRLQTRNRRIFAAGEVCGPEFAAPGAAEAMARLAVHNALAWAPKKFHRSSVPRCVDTDPQVIGIGLTPEEAEQRGYEVNTYRTEVSEADRSALDNRVGGHVEVRVRNRTGRIVGAAIVGHQVFEMLGPLGLLVVKNLSFDALADVFPNDSARLEVLRLAAGRCRQAQPPRLWSTPLEWIETCWRGVRRRIRGIGCPRTDTKSA